jgi:hypothetical protein
MTTVAHIRIWKAGDHTTVNSADDSRPQGSVNGTQPGTGNQGESRDVAARIERAYPGWLVMWSLYNREFYAFPCFRVPQGTVLHYADPGQLVAEMRTVQKAAAQASRVVAGSAGGGMRRPSSDWG